MEEIIRNAAFGKTAGRKKSHLRIVRNQSIPVLKFRLHDAFRPVFLLNILPFQKLHRKTKAVTKRAERNPVLNAMYAEDLAERRHELLHHTYAPEKETAE